MKRKGLVLFENEGARTIGNEYFNCMVGQKRRSSEAHGIDECHWSSERETESPLPPNLEGDGKAGCMPTEDVTDE